MGAMRGLVVLAACVAGLGGDAVAGEPVLKLPVRVHLLHSKEERALNTGASEGQIRAMFAKVNRIWSRTGIEWVVESVVREEAQNAGDFRRLQQIGFGRDIPFQRKTMTSIYPKDHLLTGGWNLFVIGDFGVMPPGVYHPWTRCLIVAERSNQAALNPSILAHELGHSLGLRHSTEALNLMANAQPGVPPEQKIRLLPDQVRQARKQAEAGAPYEGSLD